MATNIMTCDLSAHLRDMREKFDAKQYDAYHDAFAAYETDLDKVESTVNDWIENFGVVRLTCDYVDGRSTAYFIRANADKLDIIDHATGAVETVNTDDLAVILCYEDCKVTATANAA
jgi:hypothetical protein